MQGYRASRSALRGSRAVLAAFALLAGMSMSGCEGCGGGSSAVDAIPNVRLGMAPRDVRERFAPGAEGSWQTALGAGDDTVLEWTARQAPAKEPGFATARFEFHLAMLVAIRARTTGPGAAKDEITLTPKTVTLKAPAAEGGTAITVLARDCPTHKDESESLAARAPR